MVCAIIVGSAAAAHQVSGGLTVVGGTADQRALARWAVGRFEAAGFRLPSMQIVFPVGREGCRGRLGYYDDGVASLCGTHTDWMAARTLLHEMAHGWVDANVTGAELERFLRLRHLDTWNDQHVEWDVRGFEQAAEILAWAIGDQADGIHAPSFERNSPDELAVAYRVLTGDPLPHLQPWMTWQAPTAST